MNRSSNEYAADILVDRGFASREIDATARDIPDFITIGHSAAPLLLIGKEYDQSLVDAQNQLHIDIAEKIVSELNQKGVKSTVINWVTQSVLARMAQREALNSSSYINRVHSAPNIFALSRVDIGDIVAACDTARRGMGTIEQNRLAQIAYGMPSSEYANLTIIGDSRKEFESDMWKQLGDMVEEDVSDLSRGVYRTKVLGYDRDPRTSQHLGAVRISTKRHIGTGEYETELKVRETVILDVSKSSGFNQDIVRQVQDVARSGGDPMELDDMKIVMNALWERGMDSSIVLVRNETIYGSSREFQRAVVARRALGKRAMTEGVTYPGQ